jgi:YVTN family beta-propeller protein
LLQEAAQNAGLRRAGLVVEPVAAAIHYTSQQRVEAGAYIGVYDLGGGTFDATVLRKTDEGFEVHGTPMGDDRLGGIDFDQAVLAHVAASLGDRWSQLDLADMATLRSVAQVQANAVEAKEALSTDMEASVAVILPGTIEDVRLTRAEFEGAIRLPLQRTVEVFRETVLASGLEPAQLQRVLLIGGSSRIPLVSQLLTQQLGVRVTVDAHPKYAVCLGAAVAAGTRLTRGAPTVDSRTPRDDAAGAEPAADQERDDTTEPAAVADRARLEALVARSRGEVDTAHAEVQESAAITGDDAPEADAGAGDIETAEVDVVDRGSTTPLDAAFDDTQPVRPGQPDAGRRRRGVPLSYLIVALVAVVAGGAVWLLINMQAGNDQSSDPLPAASPSPDPTPAATQPAASEPSPTPSEARSAAPAFNAGGSPTELAVGEGAIWVTNNDEGTVTRVDPTTNDVIATIDVGPNPSDITVGAGAVWVANEGDGTVSRIDPASDQMVAAIDAGEGLSGVSASKNAIWITNKDNGTVTRVDPTTNEPIATIDVGSNPHDVRVSAGTVWIFSLDDPTVSKIDPTSNEVVDAIDVGRSPTDIGFNADAIWALDRSDSTVTCIDLATNETIATVNVGANPSDIAFGADAAWITNSGDNTVTRIDLATKEVIATVNVGASPSDIGFDDDAFWVVNAGDGTVSRIDPTSTL